MGKKLWQTGNTLNKQVEAFETGEDLLMDRKLVKYDCLGSLAQAKMLVKIGILDQKEYKKLEKALEEIVNSDKKGKFKPELGDEDLHTKIENYLTQRCGEAGMKIHTGRSRNDQVLTAIRLYEKDKLEEIMLQTKKLNGDFGNFGRDYGKLPMPGYTHMQKAMPSTVGLWAGSFEASLADDLKLLKAIFSIIDQSPLGSAAGYGSLIDVKRAFTAREMGFAAVQENSLYCQNSRGKFEANILAGLISVLSTINKFASDVILFTTSEFGFFEVEQSLTSGSSLMPQKKNVDLAELLRSKVHLVLGNYMVLVSLSSNLPSGYNRDLQDGKKPLMESLEVTLESVKMTTILLKGIKPVQKRLETAMTEELHAAQKALKLSLKGIPFREAYLRVKKRWR